MYSRVPTIVPCAVTGTACVGADASDSPSQGAHRAPRASRGRSRGAWPSSSPNARPRPWSASRCRASDRGGSCRACARRRARRQSGRRTSSACARGSGPFNSRSASAWPGRCSITRNVVPLVFTDVVEGADVRVSEGSHDPRLALEPCAAIRVGAQFGGKDLDRDRAVEAGVAGLVDLAHAARTNSRLDLVGSEAGSGDEAHGHGLRGGLYAPPCPFCCARANTASALEHCPSGVAIARAYGALAHHFRLPQVFRKTDVFQ